MQRKNSETQLWENAGQIEWTSNTSGAVYFGVERVRTLHFVNIAHRLYLHIATQVSIRELRKPKKPSSK